MSRVGLVAIAGAMLLAAMPARAVEVVWDYQAQVTGVIGSAPGTIAVGSAVDIQLRFDTATMFTSLQTATDSIFVGFELDVGFADGSFVNVTNAYFGLRNDDPVIDAFTFGSCLSCSFGSGLTPAFDIGGNFTPIASFFRDVSIPWFDSTGAALSSTDIPAVQPDASDFTMTLSSVSFDVDPEDNGIFETRVFFDFFEVVENDNGGGDIPGPVPLGLLVFGLAVLLAGRRLGA